MSRPANQTSPNAAALQDLCFFPALTLIVFLRRRVGLRMLKPNWIVRTFIFLQVYALFGVALMHGTLFEVRVIQWFSVAFVIASIAQYWRSWIEFNKGIKLHTFSSGYSLLDRSNLPRFIRSHRRVYRMLEPSLCLVVACFVLVLSPPIGLWFVFSSFSLRFFEQVRYDAALERDLDIVDGLTEADIQQQTVEFFSGGHSRKRARHQRGLDPRFGIPTGLAPDIEKQIATRRQGGKQKP